MASQIHCVDLTEPSHNIVQSAGRLKIAYPKATTGQAQEVQIQVGKVGTKESQRGIRYDSDPLSYLIQSFRVFYIAFGWLQSWHQTTNTANISFTLQLHMSKACTDKYYDIRRRTKKGKREPRDCNTESPLLPILSSALRTCKFIHDTPEPSCTSQFTRQVWTTTLILSLMTLTKASR